MCTLDYINFYQFCNEIVFFLKKVGQLRPLFCLFSFFSNTILQKNCRLRGIRTRIVEVEGEHSDHLTITL